MDEIKERLDMFASVGELFSRVKDFSHFHKNASFIILCTILKKAQLDGYGYIFLYDLEDIEQETNYSRTTIYNALSYWKKLGVLVEHKSFYFSLDLNVFRELFVNHQYPYLNSIKNKGVNHEQ